MNNVMYQTKLLNKELKRSNEYNQYVRVLGNLRAHPDLYARTLEFQRRSIHLQSGADYNTLEEVGRLRKEFEDILNQPVVIDFLGAEQRVVNMLKRTQEGILEGIELETAALDE
ncbi:MAG: YlbF family regulator [Lachnospiraceae bacterium]|nr:YlbF family regulator [Lachnospiraceae bacterium]